MLEISVSAIEHGNSLRVARNFVVDDLVGSFTTRGQLSPILVRKHPVKTGKYEVIFGNRRLEAAKKLGWQTVKAELIESSDFEALTTALAENIDRKDLSDFEVAVILERLCAVTGKQQAEVAKIVGRSPAFLSLHLSMLRLFPADAGINLEERNIVLSKLTERHARILAKIENVSERWDLAKLAVRSNMGVRELERICNRRGRKSSASNQSAVVRALVKKIVEIGSSGFDSMLSSVSKSNYISFPTLPCIIKSDRNRFKDNSWIFVRDNLGVKDTVEDLEVRTFGKFAYATAITRRQIESLKSKRTFPMRVTMIFEKEHNEWKMIHDHWSTLSVEGLKDLSTLTQFWASKGLDARKKLRQSETD